jgi:hypothetical protein
MGRRGDEALVFTVSPMGPRLDWSRRRAYFGETATLPEHRTHIVAATSRFASVVVRRSPADYYCRSRQALPLCTSRAAEPNDRAARFGSRRVRAVSRDAVRAALSIAAQANWRRGTALVPNAPSYVSRSSRNLDIWDTWDAPGRIYTNCLSAGGRKVAGSNPVAPTTNSPANRIIRFHRLPTTLRFMGVRGPNRGPICARGRAREVA